MKKIEKQYRNWFYKLAGIGIIIIGIFTVLISLTFDEVFIWLPIGFGGVLLCMIGGMVSLMKNPGVIV